MRKLTSIVSLFATALVASSYAQTDVLPVEDFESGLPSGWTFSGSALVADPNGPMTTQVLHIDQGGSVEESAITPTFNLQAGTGTFLTVEFDYQFSVEGNATRFVNLQYWDNVNDSWVNMTKLARSATFNLVTDATFTATAAAAIGSDSKFRWLGKTSGDSAQFYMDNVTVTTDAAAVPEPSAALLIGGLGVMFMLRRRRS